MASCISWMGDPPLGIPGTLPRAPLRKKDEDIDKCSADLLKSLPQSVVIATGSGGFPRG